MLSRLALRSGSLVPKLVRPAVLQSSTQPLIVVRSSSDIAKHVANWDKATKLYNGPERDTKNFPIEGVPEERPPVRIGIFPESWFTFLYDKTGVTGPYVLGAGFITFLLSKEIWVIEHGFAEFVSFWIAISWLVKKVGPGTREYLEKLDADFRAKYWDQPKAQAVATAQATVDEGEKAIWQQDGQKYIFQTKRENIDLQLEATYRQRLEEAHKAVKRRLDYHVDVENAKRNFEQTHMVNWIVNNVVKGITPQQEKESITKCIQDLKALSVKA